MKWVISKMTKSDHQQKVRIVSVIGVGGSGKTTLAKLVFNDHSMIKLHFEFILWVYVSREFDIEKLVEMLFEAIGGDKPNHRVSRAISDKLARKRFLAILDDVWTENHTHGRATIGLDLEFLQVGIEIVKKSSGVPLTFKVLVGVLHGMKGIVECQSIRESNLWMLRMKNIKNFLAKH
uniref:NB-ARC domain-containing protein n=1 Tax=Leersia perrieri TaxID=77586 RepID=A0A0D9V1S9_9ORYZ